MTDIACEEITRIYIDKEIVWWMIVAAWFLYLMLTNKKEVRK